jgi:glycosyltransferase involved in cell wall biosynthesis
MTHERESLPRTPSALVSLIMPAWNPNPAWLREAVASALGQEGCEIELILVDDGSDPPVQDLLEGLEDERMRLLRVPHGRVSRARNAGIDAARGNYVRFIDCDDVVLADSTAHLLALAGGKERVITYGATMVCDEHLRPLSTIATDAEGRVAEACLLNRFATTVHSLLYPRSVIDEVGPWEPSIVVSQDWDYALRAFERAPVRGDRRVATYYRMHAAMNSKNVEEGIRGYRLVVDRYFDRHPEQRGKRVHRRATALYHLFAAVQLATRLRRYRASMGHVRRALSLDFVAVLTALPRHGAMPLMPTANRVRRLLPRRWPRRS